MPCSASVRWFICVALCEVLGLRVQLHTHHSQRSCASVSRVGDLSMQVDRSKLRKVPCPAVQCPALSHAQPPVVVTGLGTLTSLGHDAHTFFDNLVEGKCGIDYVTRFDAEKWEVPARIASEVKDFDVGQYWRMKDAKRCVPRHLPPTSVWICMHIGAPPPRPIALEVYLRIATLRASL
eukprot:scaffold89436_cov39-Phaeocystis_antarctica.AAC.1